MNRDQPDISGTGDGDLGDPIHSRRKKSPTLGLEYILQPKYIQNLQGFFTRSKDHYYPPRGATRKAGQHRHLWLARLPDQIKIDFLFAIRYLAAPLFWTCLFLDLAQHTGMRGIQEWLSSTSNRPKLPRTLSGA